MPKDVSSQSRELLVVQGGAIALFQRAPADMDPRTMRSRTSSGRWQRLRRGVYAAGVCVELDGTAAHPAEEQWRDKRRDNANLVQGIVTLRFGLPDLGDRRCESAAAVAAVLRLHGWPGSMHPCVRPACAVRDGIP